MARSNVLPRKLIVMASPVVPQSAAVGPVSAVIPCYNCASTLERAVSSVAAQTLRPSELILVDDASTDSTRALIQELQQRYGTDWVRAIALTSNSGPATARNVGWDAARFPFIAFLDADDAWAPGKIEQQVEYMQSHPVIELTAHGCRSVRAADDGELRANLRGVRRLTCGALLVSNRIATRTVMLKREAPYRFLDGKRYAEDYLLWLQMACDGRRMELLEAELAYVFRPEFSEGGLSARLWRMERGELAVYWQMVRERRLGMLVAVMCSAYSLLKYLRRVAIVMARKRQRRRAPA